MKYVFLLMCFASEVFGCGKEPISITNFFQFKSKTSIIGPAESIDHQCIAIYEVKVDIKEFEGFRKGSPLAFVTETNDPFIKESIRLASETINYYLEHNSEELKTTNLLDKIRKCISEKKALYGLEKLVLCGEITHLTIWIYSESDDLLARVVTER